MRAGSNGAEAGEMPAEWWVGTDGGCEGEARDCGKRSTAQGQ